MPNGAGAGDCKELKRTGQVTSSRKLEQRGSDLTSPPHKGVESGESRELRKGAGR